VPEWLRFEPDPARQVPILESITDFQSRGVIEKSPPTSAGETWLPNGRARVVQLNYQPDRLRIEIEAEKASLLATSITGWPGWHLTVDGKPTPLVGYNHAFLAFEVPPGRHSAELLYRPRSVIWGSVISAATVGLIAILLMALPSARRA
jgi:hypothetical protein